MSRLGQLRLVLTVPVGNRATMPFKYVHRAESRRLEREEEAEKIWLEHANLAKTKIRILSQELRVMRAYCSQEEEESRGIFRKSALVYMIAGDRVDVQCTRLCLLGVSVNSMMVVVHVSLLEFTLGVC